MVIVQDSSMGAKAENAVYLWIVDCCQFRKSQSSEGWNVLELCRRRCTFLTLDKTSAVIPWRHFSFYSRKAARAKERQRRAGDQTSRPGSWQELTWAGLNCSSKRDLEIRLDHPPLLLGPDHQPHAEQLAGIPQLPFQYDSVFNGISTVGQRVTELDVFLQLDFALPLQK